VIAIPWTEFGIRYGVIHGGKGYCVLLGLGITSPPGANPDGLGDFVDSA
jgi:hypothetical protein